MSHAKGNDETADEIRPKRIRSGPLHREKSQDPFDCKNLRSARQIGSPSGPKRRFLSFPASGPVEDLVMNLDAQQLFPFLDSPDPPSSVPEEEKPGEPEGRLSFYILDAYSLIFQVFHAIFKSSPEMAGPAGQPTQAVFGIFRD